MLRVGVNGFGSVGRRFHRAALERDDIQVVAVNGRTDPGTLAHLLKYDTNYGTLSEDVEVFEKSFAVGGKTVMVYTESEPAKIPWKDQGVDIVVESTGRFTDATVARGHIDPGGAKKVVISAPAKNEDVTLVIGANEEQYDPLLHHIISNSSCTTNGLAPVVRVIDEVFGLEEGLMTTVHAYTRDQVLVDSSHKDLRRARAGALNIIPTTTGAAKSIGLVLPHLKGKLNGMSLRVPISTVSVIDLVVRTRKPVTQESANEAFAAAARGHLKGILGVSYEPLVSSDYRGMKESSVVDALSTTVVGGLLKVVAWYDNEWGYSERLVDLVSLIASRGL